MSAQVGISIEQVGFGYNGNLVLESVTFEIQSGRMWALIGRSGVGKTTLLQVVAGLFQPPVGSVIVTGRKQDGAGRIKGVVFQEESLLGWLTVQQNLLFPCHEHPTDEAVARVVKILGEVGLRGYENTLPSVLSTGMRKRVEFVRALLADDTYLLADEPFGTLDALTRRDLWKVWQALRKSEPRTGILSTHDPEEALRLCDVVVPLIPGPPARLGEPIEVPPEVSALATNENDEKLVALKERLIACLSVNGGGQ